LFQSVGEKSLTPGECSHLRQALKTKIRWVVSIRWEKKLAPCEGPQPSPGFKNKNPLGRFNPLGKKSLTPGEGSHLRQALKTICHCPYKHNIEF